MLVNEDSFRYCWRGLEEGHGRVGCSPAGRQGFSSTFSVWLQRLDTLDMWCYAIQCCGLSYQPNTESVSTPSAFGLCVLCCVHSDLPASSIAA